MKSTNKKPETPVHVASLRHLDFCITTFENPDGLERLLHSIADDKRYAGANIYIADSSHNLDRAYYKKLRGQLGEAGLITRMKIHQVAYKANIGTARNFLVSVSTAKYKLFLHDTDFLTEETDLLKLVSILDGNKAVGIVGGTVVTGGKKNTPEGDGVILEVNGVKFQKTNLLNEFVVARRDLFITTRYNPDANEPHLAFCNAIKNAPFEMVVTDVSINRENDNAKEETDADQNIQTPGSETNGAGSGATTERTVQSQDGNGAGSDSVPGRQDGQSPDTTTGGR